MKILLTYAVDPEFDPWKKLRKFRDVSAASFTIRRTEINGASVDFLVTGMGPAHSRQAMEAIAANEYDACISSGFAGSLSESLGIGDIVVPKAVCAVGTPEVPCDAKLVEQAIGAGGKGIHALVSSDHIATTVAAKFSLAQYGEAVDMESFTVLNAGRTRNMPVVAIRIVSDRHDQALPVDLSAAIDERGQPSIGRVLKMVAGNPGQISALMKLGRDSRAGAEALARFLSSYIEKIGGPGPSRE